LMTEVAAAHERLTEPILEEKGKKEEGEEV
jgi:hypothetical protein